MAERLLEVTDLSTHFFTYAGVVKAVNGVSFTLDRDETLGIVGESGSGKTVTAMSVMRLIPDPPGRIVGGGIVHKGRDLLALSKDEMSDIRGNDIAMIFQDPMTSLNPVFKIGDQIAEVDQAPPGQVQARVLEAGRRPARQGRHPRPPGARQPVSVRVLRRHAAARHDRHGDLAATPTSSSPTSPRPRST